MKGFSFLIMAVGLAVFCTNSSESLAVENHLRVARAAQELPDPPMPPVPLMQEMHEMEHMASKGANLMTEPLSMTRNRREARGGMGGGMPTKKG